MRCSIEGVASPPREDGTIDSAYGFITACGSRARHASAILLLRKKPRNQDCLIWGFLPGHKKRKKKKREKER
jgi:hypothetical protein